MFKPIEEKPTELWGGKQNLIVRLLTYTIMSANQLNNYKYIAAAIFGFYYTFKLTNPLWLIGMFLIALPLMAYHGKWWLHKGAKTSEYVTTQIGSVLGYDAFNVQVAILKELEILKRIEVSKHNEAICASSNCEMCRQKLTK